MGMDLQPINPSINAPIDSDGDVKWGRHNWSGWSELITLLESWGVDTKEFVFCNDGDIICEATCLKVAKALKDNLPNQPENIRNWLEPKIILWETCGGYKQF